MADTTTTNYGLTKPEVGASEDTWGTKINADLDTIDSTMKSISDAANSALEKDPTLTMSGDVTGSATFTNLGNATLTATVVDDSHSHSTSTITGLGSLATLSAVGAAQITDNSVGAAELNVSGNGTSGQMLTSDGDGTFSWADAGGGGAVPFDWQIFTSSGTWTKPAGAEYVLVQAIGGGAGGRVQPRPAGGSGCGGGGGGGVIAFVDASLLGSTETVTVAGRAASATSGSATSFGGKILANGGSTGNTGGSCTGGSGGNGTANISTIGIKSFSGGSGGNAGGHFANQGGSAINAGCGGGSHHRIDVFNGNQVNSAGGYGYGGHHGLMAGSGSAGATEATANPADRSLDSTYFSNTSYKSGREYGYGGGGGSSNTSGGTGGSGGVLVISYKSP